MPSQPPLVRRYKERGQTVDGRVRLGIYGGLLAPPLFVIATGAITLVDWAFLEESDWSAVHRSEVEWPSLLLLGPNGGVAAAAFVACGVLVVGFASALRQVVFDIPLMRATALLLGAAGLALCLVAFRPDPPGFDSDPTWHDRIHNVVYPVIPISAILGAGLLWAGARRTPGWRGMSRVSLAAVAVAAPAFVLSGIGSIAQLARYVLFGALLAWLETLAVAAAGVIRRRPSPDQTP